MASFSDTKITPANGQKLPAVDGSTTGYMMSDELKAYILSALGQANGIASLDSTGKLPSTQLPDFANDVLAFDSIASFPATGADGVLYIAKNTNTLYRWTGTQYVQLTADISGKEDKFNKVTSITPASTDEQYPSAKAVYAETARLEDTIKEISTDLGDLETEVSTLEDRTETVESDIITLKDATDSLGAENIDQQRRISELETKLQEQTLINARQNRQIENLNDSLDGDLIENKYKMTGETPDDAGVLSLPSSKLLPWSEVDEVHGQTVAYSEVDMGSLEWGMYSINGFNYFSVELADKKNSVDAVTTKEGLFCSAYPCGGVQYGANFADKHIYEAPNNRYVYVRDSAYSSASAFKSAMTGVILRYDGNNNTLHSARNVKVVSHGKNWFDSVIDGFPNTNGSGINAFNGTKTAFAKVDGKGGKFTLSCSRTCNRLMYGVSHSTSIVAGNYTYVQTSDISGLSRVLDVPSGWEYIFVYLGNDFSDSNFTVQFEIGEQSTSYVPPHSSHTLTIPQDWYTKASALGYDLGMEGTVIDMINKVVTWNWRESRLESLRWVYFESRGVYYVIVPDMKPRGNIIAEKYPVTTANSGDMPSGHLSTNNAGFGSSSCLFYKDSVTPTGKFVYELATPITKTFEELGFDPIDNGLPVESNGTITVISDGAQAEAKIHYAIDNRSTT